MKIYEITDPIFKDYGKVIEGVDNRELISAMEKIPYEEGVSYIPAIDSLESCAIFDELGTRVFGGMPIQLGMCWGHNTKLNCLEYHRDSEINIGTHDFVILVAKEAEIENGKLDSSKVVAFHVPGGVAVEVFASTLHYAPCEFEKGKGFRVAIVLPRGTNTAKPEFEVKCYEDTLLTARNKWLLAHEESAEAKSGAVVAITGCNIDIADLIK